MCVCWCVCGGGGCWGVKFVSLHGALSLLSNCGLFFMSGVLNILGLPGTST